MTVKASHSDEGVRFRAILNRWNIDILFLTRPTTKEALLPREGGERLAYAAHIHNQIWLVCLENTQRHNSLL